MALLGPVLVFYLVFLAAPYAVLLRLSFYKYSALRLYVPEFTWANYAAVMTDPFYLGLVGRTVLLGVGVGVATLVLGYPLALTVARAGPRLRVALLQFYYLIDLQAPLAGLVAGRRTWIWRWPGWTRRWALRRRRRLPKAYTARPTAIARCRRS